MNLIKAAALVAIALLLAGCKPPKFDQEITCPGFHAWRVAVYEYGNANSYVVIYPDYTKVVVDRTECVIAHVN